MWMTPGEICREYRQAKKKAAQIGILADLNSCSKDEIREVLQRNGIQVKIRKRAPNVTWTAEEIEICRSMAEQGVPRKEIAKMVPRHTRSGLNQKLYTMGYISRDRPNKGPNLTKKAGLIQNW